MLKTFPHLPFNQKRHRKIAYNKVDDIPCLSTWSGESVRLFGTTSCETFMECWNTGSRTGNWTNAPHESPAVAATGNLRTKQIHWCCMKLDNSQFLLCKSSWQNSCHNTWTIVHCYNVYFLTCKGTLCLSSSATISVALPGKSMVGT